MTEEPFLTATATFLDEARRTRDLAVLDMKYGHQHLDATLQRAFVVIESLRDELLTARAAQTRAEDAGRELRTWLDWYANGKLISQPSRNAVELLDSTAWLEQTPQQEGTK